MSEGSLGSLGKIAQPTFVNSKTSGFNPAKRFSAFVEMIVPGRQRERCRC